MFLTVIVPGPKSPKQKLDVYLQPLVVELKDLWLNGVCTYDSWRKQNFVLRAAVIWTISDFPAYSMLYGMLLILHMIINLKLLYIIIMHIYDL